jgi:hypothetical protein
MALRSSECKSGSIGVAGHVELKDPRTTAIPARNQFSYEADAAGRRQTDDVVAEPNRAA